MKVIWLIVALSLASCSERNTRTFRGFSVYEFEKVAKGSSKSEVEKLLGSPFSYYTHVIFQDGTGNNYPKVIDPDPSADFKVFRYVGVYSQAIRKTSDYRVFEIFYDKDWTVSGRQTYVTD